MIETINDFDQDRTCWNFEKQETQKKIARKYLELIFFAIQSFKMRGPDPMVLKFSGVLLLKRLLLWILVKFFNQSALFEFLGFFSFKKSEEF